MLKRKRLRNKGKIKFSDYFRKFKEDERVAVIRELSENPSFPKKLQGRTGIIKGKRGRSYLVEMNDIKKSKTYIIHPVHLRRLK